MTDSTLRRLKVGEAAGDISVQARKPWNGSCIAIGSGTLPCCAHEGNVAPIVQSLRHYYLDDQREQDDSVGPYRKSLLYLVSRAFQDRDKVVPVMGMEIYQAQVKDALAATPVTATVKQFNTRDNPGETASSEHGKFDFDPTTMNSMLRAVLGMDPARKFEKGDLN